MFCGFHFATFTYFFCCGEILVYPFCRGGIPWNAFFPRLQTLSRLCNATKEFVRHFFLLFGVLRSPGNDAPPVRLSCFIFAFSSHYLENYSNSPALKNGHRDKSLCQFRIVKISLNFAFFREELVFEASSFDVIVIVVCTSTEMHITRQTMNLHDKLHQNKLLYRKNEFRNERHEDERENCTFLFWFVPGCRRMIVL